MSSTLRKAPALALVAALFAAAPAAAHQGGGPGGGGAGQASSRVVLKARSAVRAVDLAGQRLDDGDTAKAISQLAASRRYLAAAQKTALSKLSGDTGPGSIAVVLRAEGSIAVQAAGLFDGQDGATVDALAQTLKLALDDRDAAVAAITALDDSAEVDYVGAYSIVSDRIADELDGYDGAISDDTLSADAKTALTAAKTQATATQTAVEARISALDDSSSSGNDDQGDGPPPGGHGGRGGGPDAGGDFGAGGF
ncbi:MAG TPA: hypothetical protein VMT10_15490 [Solirubrobacteraceae bacterium]|nr:hypothetical protein [Solirubrobacteraceae bacterium]